MFTIGKMRDLCRTMAVSILGDEVVEVRHNGAEYFVVICDEDDGSHVLYQVRLDRCRELNATDVTGPPIRRGEPK